MRKLETSSITKQYYKAEIRSESWATQMYVTEAAPAPSQTGHGVIT